MRKKKLMICGRIVDSLPDKLSGITLKNLLGIKKDRTLVKKELNGANTIIKDNDILKIPDDPDDLFLDDIPTLREGY